MNVSALAQMTRHWDAALASLRCIRAAVVGEKPELTALELLRVVDVAAFAPVALRREHVAFIPAPVAVTHKLVVGIQSALHALLVHGRASEYLTAAELHAFVDEHGLLIGDDEVCAGPPALITRALETICEARSGETRRPSPAVVRIGRLGHWTELITLLFAMQAAQLWHELSAISPLQSALKLLRSRTRPPLMRAAFEAADGVVEPLRGAVMDLIDDDRLRELVDAMHPFDLIELHDLPVPGAALDVTIRYLTLERGYLRALERIEAIAGPAPTRGPRRVEGLYISAWLGPMVRDVVEKAARITLQNTARTTWIISPRSRL